MRATSGFCLRGFSMSAWVRVAALVIGVALPAVAQGRTYNLWSTEELARIDQRLRGAPGDGRLWMQRACALARLGRLGEAAHAADTALALGPEDARMYHNSARISELRGNFGHAERMYRRAIALDGKLASVREGLAVLLCKTRRAEEGLAVLEGLLEERPTSARLRRNAAVAALNLGQPTRALSFLSAAQGEDERQEQRLLLSRALCDLADSLLVEKLAQRAAAVADSALRLDPGSGRACVLRGRGELRLGHLDAADRLVKRALRATPGDCDALVLLTRILARQGDRAASDSAAAAADPACTQQVLSGW